MCVCSTLLSTGLLTRRLAATVEAPPNEDEEGYDAFVKAYKAFLTASEPSMSVPKLKKDQMDGALAVCQLALFLR